MVENIFFGKGKVTWHEIRQGIPQWSLIISISEAHFSAIFIPSAPIGFYRALKVEIWSNKKFQVVCAIFFIYLALASRSSGFLKIVDFLFLPLRQIEHSKIAPFFRSLLIVDFSHIHNQNLFWFDFRSNYQVPPKRQRPLQRFHLLQIAQWVKMSKKYQKFCAKKNSDMRFINFSGFFFYSFWNIHKLMYIISRVFLPGFFLKFETIIAF